MSNNKDITTGLFRMSALIYANNNDGNISIKQIHKKVIEDALLKMDSTKAVSLAELSFAIQENYGGLSFTEREIEDILDAPKYKDNFDSYEENDVRMVSLGGKRRATLENAPQIKSLQSFIEDYLESKNIDKSKTEVFRRFFYGVFTTNLSAYKKLLQEKLTVDLPDDSFAEEDRVIINDFLNQDNPEKNKAIFNFASSALEYCMMTNQKNATLQINNLKNKNLYLDTNILFRVMGLNGDDRQQRTQLFLRNISRENLQQRIFITKKTEEEFKSTLSYQLEKLEDALKPAANVNPKVYAETVQIDGIYKYYFKWKIGRTNNSVEYFKNHILSTYENIKENYKISKDSMVPFDEYDETINKQITDYASSLRTFDSEKQITASEIDAYNMIWIESKRKESNDDIFSTKDFFISSDQSLRIWDYNRNLNNVPIVMLPSQWLSLILRYITRTDDDYKSFVCFLNMKVNDSLMSEEQFLYAIQGISETTTDVSQQKHLIEQFVNSDFQKVLSNMPAQEIRERAKSFAETEQDKVIKELQDNKLQKEDEISQLVETNQEKSSEIERLKAENAQLRQTHAEELREKESEINKKQETIDKQKLREWKKPRIIWCIIGSIVLIVLLMLCFIFLSEDWNFVSKLIEWVDSLTETPKKIAHLVIFGLYMFFWVLVVRAFFAIITVKSYDDRKEWRKQLWSNIKEWIKERF